MIKKYWYYVTGILVLTLTALTVLSTQSQAAPKKKILFVRKGGASFEEVTKKMTADMKKYDVEDFIITDQTPASDFNDKVKSVNPNLMVLMDNRSVDYGIKYNAASPKKIPGVGLMGLNLQVVLKDNPNLAGVAFESPAYTLVTQFKHFTEVPIKNVLVFYRKSTFSEMVNQGRDQLKMENINLIAVDVEKNGKEKEKIAEFLKTEGAKILEDRSKYDAVWCLVDSVILTKDLMVGFWLPVMNANKVPLLTGVEPFVNPAMGFGVFAVTPNLADLAGQAGQIVERILDSNEAPGSIGVEQLISVDKVVNTKKADELGYKIKPEVASDAKMLK